VRWITSLANFMEAQFTGGLSLLGRIIPTQVTGKDDAPLIPDHAGEAEKAAEVLMLLVRSRWPKPGDEDVS
jgi:hypothetical protein